MQVYALVGPSGSGKSHHASLLANELGIEVIIDDGLAIQNGKILAGRSAKREANRLAAVRRAIFADSGHATEVRDAVMAVKPARTLIIGTSRTMVTKIADVLSFPEIDKYIDIQDIATADDIKRAQKIRKEQGKHVIPAPTLEVKKTFSGYLIDPLRFLLPKKSEKDNLVIEKSVVRPTWSSLGKFFIADSVVGSIAVRSCKEVQGIARVRKVRVESTEQGVNIDLEVAIFSNTVPFDVLKAAQQHVKNTVEHCTALNVLTTDVMAKKMVLADA